MTAKERQILRIANGTAGMDVHIKSTKARLPEGRAAVGAAQHLLKGSGRKAAHARPAGCGRLPKYK